MAVTVVGLSSLGVVAATGQSLEDAITAGTAALQRGAPQEALTHWRIAAAKAPDDPMVHAWHGIVAEAAGELDEAIEAQRTAFGLEPSSLNRLRLGMLARQAGLDALAVEHLRASLASAGTQRRVVAESLFQILVETGARPDALALARAEGWLDAEATDYCQPGTVAISLETRGLLALLLHPDRADCAFTAAASLTRGGLVRLPRLILAELAQRTSVPALRERAERFLRSRLPRHDVAKRAESLNVTAYNLWVRASNGSSAVAIFRKAIAADPKFSWPYGNIGWVYMSQRQPELALPWYVKAVTINPDHWRAQVGLAGVWYALRRWEDARDAYQRAVALDPDDASSHQYLGWSLVRLGQSAEALQAFDRAVRLNPALQQERDYIRRSQGADPVSGPTPFGEASRNGRDPRAAPGVPGW